MNTAQSRAIGSDALSLFVIFLCFSLITGCEDPGVVGGGFTDTNTTIKVDTFHVDGVGTENFEYYTGNLDFLSAGQFNDPLFGDIKATGLIRPSLVDSGDVASDATMRLKLVFNQQAVYGDSAKSAGFALYQMTQPWRGNAWKITDQPQFESPPSAVSFFSVADQDSIENITLSDEWMQQYRQQVNREPGSQDYRVAFPGVGIVPQDTSKILPINPSESQFIIENSEDTLQAPLLDWGYSLERNNVASPPPFKDQLHSTLEQVLTLDLELDREELVSINISKVELVLHEDNLQLENSMDNVSPTAGRPEVAAARLHLFEPQEVPIAFETGGVLANGIYNEEDGTYRFNITSFTNNVLNSELPSELQYYVTLQTPNGIVRSSLIYNEKGPQAKRPKFIVTYVETQEDSTD